MASLGHLRPPVLAVGLPLFLVRDAQRRDGRDSPVGDVLLIKAQGGRALGQRGEVVPLRSLVASIFTLRVSTEASVTVSVCVGVGAGFTFGFVEPACFCERKPLRPLC